MRYLSLALVVCMLAACASCAAPTQQEPPPIILGFSQLGSESGWRVGNTKDIYAAAEREGVTLLYKNADQKQENQIKAIREFIAQQVDVIAFSPIVESGWVDVLREAKEAGIPVLLTDRFIEVDEPGLFAGFVGSNFLEEGRRAGRFLARKCAGRESVQIVEIAGTPESTPAKERADGFREFVDVDPRFEIVTSVSGDFLRSKGKECMQNILREVPDIDVLYSHNDAMTLGAIDLLKDGKINCVVECTPLIGDVVMRLSKRLARGEQIALKTYSSERTFSEYDADLDSLPPRGY